MHYTADELRTLDHGRPPARALRKIMFTFRLWRPAYNRCGYRPAVAIKTGITDPEVNKSSRRSAVSLSIGWLNVQSLTNKTEAVSETIVDESLDVMALSETWHADSGDVRLRLATPPGYAVVDNARSTMVRRSTDRGGGVAIIYRKHLRCSMVPLPSCTTFESICVRLSSTSGPIIMLNLYRPGSGRPTALFFNELASVFEVLVLHSCPVVIGGDFNVHIQDADDPDTRRLSDLLSSFDMLQHVTGPTHRRGGTLDLVITFGWCKPDDLVVDPAGIISDHSLVVCHLPIVVGQSPIAERLVRGWKRVDRAALRLSLENSPLCCPVSSDTDVDDLFATYDRVLGEIADRVAKQHVVRCRPGRLAPWFDAGCRAARRECRRLERLYRRTKTDTDRRRWIDAAHHRFQLYRKSKEDYWLGRLNQHEKSSTLLWRSLSTALGRDRNVTSSTGHSAEGFATFFERKVDDVMTATEGLPPPSIPTTASASLASFNPYSQADIRRIIMKSPVKSCSLDSVPTFLVREFVDLLLPYLTSMVNASLIQGRLPASQKHAIVTPLLKKPGLDTADMNNFRPVSNVPFMSKVVERAVAKQLNDFLTDNGLLPRCQSAYRKRHSTETAMLRMVLCTDGC